MLEFGQTFAKPWLCQTTCFCCGLNDCDALTICHKVFGHVEGDLDGERAGVLRAVDHGDDACADGDQRQGDFAQRTVSVTWGWRKRGRSTGQRSDSGPFMHPWEDELFSDWRDSGNLILNPDKSIEFISWFVTQDQLGWNVCGITFPIWTWAEQLFTHTSLSNAWSYFPRQCYRIGVLVAL